MRVMKFILVCFIFFALPTVCLASDYISDYQVDYYLVESGNSIKTRVKFKIDITNLRADVFVKKMTLAFPDTFSISNVSASDDKGSILPQLNHENVSNNIILEFSDPVIGKDSVNSFFLEFDQDNLVQKKGNIWEIILPTLNKETRNNYKVILHIPEAGSKKISLAKPKPDFIDGQQIVWNNPSNKTIYIALGDKQFYFVQLGYHLKNPQFVPAYTDVVFPPDTIYQKNYIKTISPKPASVYLDNDGNYLGRYIVKPNSTLDIDYEGFIEVFIQPRDSVLTVNRQQIDSQKVYLLNPDRNWDLKNKKVEEELDSANIIYSYVTSRLSYDYKGTGQNNTRMGALKALENPTKAVCVEFSDLFIALAREKGIYSREIQGFAFSQDQSFRPLSLASDILHSWPEYYDSQKNIWIPVDPTWENTSGIDYFNSFDFNHLAFVIHGKKSDYPLPAGMYKTEESRDIIVKTVEGKVDDMISLTIDSINFPTIVTDKKPYQLKFSLVNNSNVFLWQLPVKLNGKTIAFDKNELLIPVIAPYEKKSLTFNLAFAPVKRKTLVDFQILVMGNELLKKRVAVFPHYYNLALKISYFLIGFIVLFLIREFFFKKRARG